MSLWTEIVYSIIKSSGIISVSPFYYFEHVAYDYLVND